MCRVRRDSTPSGELSAAVRYDEKWPFGLDIPLFHDWTGHYVEPWLKTEYDLDCLRHILLPISKNDDVARLKFGFDAQKKLAKRFDLPIIAHVGMGLTGAMQLAGATELCMMTAENPDMVDGYLELEHRMNLRHMEISLGFGADIIQRNGFYETSDFYSPASLERFLAARLAKEAEVVHQAG